MPLGQVISEWKGKITAIKNEPFATGAEGIRQEWYLLAQQSGRLNGNEVGTLYSTMSPDGSLAGEYYGVLTTADGEAVTVVGKFTAMMISPSQARFVASPLIRTASSKLAWLNGMLTAFEGIGDLAKMELEGKIYEWT
jgi:hypothetical protein